MKKYFFCYNASYMWNTFFFRPLYNSLVFLVDLFPYHNMLIAVIVLTVVVRFILAPLSYKSIKTQIQTKKIQPKLKEIKETISDKQEQARATLALYKENGINPFSNFFLLLIQFPIIIALYRVFQGGIEFNPEILYSFVNLPETIKTIWLGLDLASKSYLLAFLAGFTQFLYVQFSTSMRSMTEKKENQSEQEKMMAMVGSSMKYTLPVMITIFAYTLGAPIALYFLTSNVFMICQEFYIQKKLKQSNI